MAPRSGSRFTNLNIEAYAAPGSVHHSILRRELAGSRSYAGIIVPISPDISKISSFPRTACLHRGLSFPPPRPNLGPRGPKGAKSHETGIDRPSSRL